MEENDEERKEVRRLERKEYGRNEKIVKQRKWKEIIKKQIKAVVTCL
jgi:hypothetical protein